MEFKISPFHKNSYPKRGLLIKGPDAAVWLSEAYKAGIDPEKAVMYALPDKVANKLYGCLVVLPDDMKHVDAGKNSFMQCVKGRLFIPENSAVSPELADAEWDTHFGSVNHVMHPDIGLAELSEAIDWNLLLGGAKEVFPEVIRPSKGVYIPQIVRSLSIDADESDLAKNVEKEIGKPNANDAPFNIDKIMKGNEKEIDKLIKYLDKHPEMALKFGIPLDVTGSLRGGGRASFRFGKMSDDTSSALRSVLLIVAGIICFVVLISFFMKEGGKPTFPFFIIFFIARFIYQKIKDEPSGNTGFGGSAVINNDKFATLQEKYEKLAKNLIAQKEYQKASAIYLKLLKNHFRAAQVLEEGGYYGEAGAIYLKYCKDKQRAASCFEKGRLYTQAIDLYKELNDREKVGDLYKALNKTKEANSYYEMVAEDYIKNLQYVKASLIYNKKMDMPLKAQGLLLEGWHKSTGLTAHNSLNTYFNNIEDVSELGREICRVYKEELEDRKKEAFLQVIKLEFHKHDQLKPVIKDIAYKIIASCMDAAPFMASELIAFNSEDKSISKDVMKFKSSKRKA